MQLVLLYRLGFSYLEHPSILKQLQEVENACESRVFIGLFNGFNLFC